MNSIGLYLRKQREQLSLSLNEVWEHTGITTSRLNRIERNKIKEPSPDVLKKLAILYRVDIIYLYQLAGYLESLDIKEKANPFKNYELLDDDEHEFIQQSIDFLVQKHIYNNKEDYHEI